jgi:hypothetical protein
MIHIKISKVLGIILRPSSFWIGVHYSKYCKRICINLIPCFTIYIGEHPKQM